MLISGVVSFAILMGFAQNQPTNSAQETLDFMRSPNGTGVVHRVQILTAASFGMIGVSNELVRVSNDNTLSTPIRQSASAALVAYDSSATNSYQEIEAFLTAWPFREKKTPPMTTDTIAVMKRTLEIGSSAFAQLRNYQSDTNLPALYREDIGKAISEILN